MGDNWRQIAFITGWVQYGANRYLYFRLEILVKINCCGRNCEKCSIYKIDCQGCYNYRPKEPVQVEENMCPIYECAMKKLENRICSECPDLPCNLFNVCVNHKLTLEEIEIEKKKRIEFLKNLKL